MTVFDDEFAADDFFADADYNDVEVQESTGFQRLEAGDHKVIITEAGPIETKRGKQFRIEFTAEGPKTYTEWFEPINPGDEAKTYPMKNGGEISVRDIKRQKRVNVLTALGVPKEGIAKLNPADLVNIEGTLRLFKNGKGYINFGSFTVHRGGSVGTPLKVSVPARPEIREFATAAVSDSEYGI